MKVNNLKIYYALTFINNLWFITSSWLVFWLKFMSFKQVGIIDSASFMTGILLEFPSGVISDKIGRKQTLIISQAFLFLGSLLILLASSLYDIAAGFIIFQIGVSFYSGTIESFGFETSFQNKINYDSVLIKSSILNNVAYLASLIIGGYLYLTDTNLPNLLMTINFFAGLIISFFIIDSINTSEVVETRFNYKIHLNLPILVLFIVLMSVAFSFDYGFLKLVILDKFSNLNTNYWYIFGATTLSLLVSNSILSSIKTFFKPLILCIVLLIISTILIFVSYIPLFITLSFLAVFVYQLSLKYINEKVADSERASAISLFNLFYKLPYVLIALILGYNLG